MFTPSRFLAVGTAALCLTLATACSSGSDSASSAGPAEDELTKIPDVAVETAIAGKLPADVKSAGSLKIAMSADTPPMGYIAEDNSTIVGFDVDMSNAIAATLGLKADIKNVGFDTIIPGLQAKRFDLALSSMGVTLKRQKVVDFVSYYNGGQGFLASSDSDFSVESLEDLCGLKVAVQTGTTQQFTLEDEADTCKKAGKEPWEVQTFPGTNEAVLAISGNRVDVFYGSISVVSYTAKQNSDFRVAGTYKRAIVGTAFPKRSPLVPVVQEAIQHLIDDGTYQDLLDKWGFSDNGITTAEVNGAVS